MEIEIVTNVYPDGHWGVWAHMVYDKVKEWWDRQERDWFQMKETVIGNHHYPDGRSFAEVYVPLDIFEEGEIFEELRVPDVKVTRRTFHCDKNAYDRSEKEWNPDKL